jgi:hypothetical protein
MLLERNSLQGFLWKISNSILPKGNVPPFFSEINYNHISQEGGKKNVQAFVYVGSIHSYWDKKNRKKCVS